MQPKVPDGNADFLSVISSVATKLKQQNDSHATFPVISICPQQHSRSCRNEFVCKQMVMLHLWIEDSGWDLAGEEEESVFLNCIMLEETFIVLSPNNSYMECDIVWDIDGSPVFTVWSHMVAVRPPATHRFLGSCQILYLQQHCHRVSSNVRKHTRGSTQMRRFI